MPQPQRWKTAQRELEVLSPACCNKAMPLDTCWPPRSQERLLILRRTPGDHSIGLVRVYLCSSSFSDSVSTEILYELAMLISLIGLGETDAYLERQRVRAAGENVGKTFVKEGKVALKRHWLLLIYMVLLMAGFNFMSHGSQDLYPTMLENEYEFDSNAVTVTQVVANLGAMAGGTTIGYLSQM